MKVVFDTNIYISAFAIPGGNAEEAYLYAVHRRFELFVSTSILTETANTLLDKFSWSDEKVARLLSHIGQFAAVLKTHPHIHILQDEPDNRILECAAQSAADVIVTGDQHLLALKHFNGTAIVRLADFLTRIRTPGELPE